MRVIGPGAHGRLTIDGRRVATETEKRPEAWLMRVETNGTGVTVSEKLTAGETADEYLLMGLRLVEGIDLERYNALSGRTLDPERISFLRERRCCRNDGRWPFAGYTERLPAARRSGRGSRRLKFMSLARTISARG